MARRPARSLLLLGSAALALSAWLVAPASGGVSARATDAPPGRAASARVLDQDQAQFYGYDAHVDGSGNSYLAWIASHAGGSRMLHLCYVPKGSLACSGGVQQRSALGSSSAAGLRVLDVAGTPTLVWAHESAGGPNKISTAEVDNGVLQNAVDRADAPAFGGLYDAAVSPAGEIWAVTWAGSGDTIQIHPGLGDPYTTINPTNLVAAARIAFDHEQGVVAFSDSGISSRVRVTSQRPDGTWRASAAIPQTWALGGNFDLVRGRGQTVRIVTSVPNANYYPQVAAWRGTEFGAFTRTGYSGSCEWTTHDLWADTSGRIADASFSCGTVRIFNQPTAARGRAATWSDSRTPVGGNGYASNGPQIATSPRGTGWLMYTRMGADPGDSIQLLAVPVRLPALSRTVSDASAGGRAVLTGPVSCLPHVDTAVSVVARRASGWSVVSKSLLRDGSAQGPTLHGERLAPGSTHTLTGKVVFGKGGQRATSIARLTFKACSGPSAFNLP
jgi:hypothetical protein